MTPRGILASGAFGALLLLSPLVAAAAEQPAACKPQRVAEVETRLNDEGLILAKVGLGVQPAMLALDTGAYWSVLRETAAAPFHHGEATDMTSLGAGGVKLDHSVTLPTLLLGGASFSNVKFLIGSDRLNNDPGVSGNLGTSLLKDYDLEIDPAAGKLRLFKPMPTQKPCTGGAVYWRQADATSIPFDLDQNWIVIPVTLDGKPLRAVLDTGASTSTLTFKAAKALYGLDEHSAGVTPMGTATTLDGQGIGLYKRKFKSLQIGGISFDQPTLTMGADNIEAANRKGSTSQVPDLVLGMHQLRELHLYLAYSEHKLYASTTKGDTAARTAADKSTAPPAPHQPVDTLDRQEARDDVERARAHAQKQEYDAALRDFDQAIAIAPEESWIYSFRGLMQGQRLAYAQAIADFTRAIELDPKNAAAYLNRGEALSISGEVARAIEDMNKALALDPKLKDGYLARAEIYQRTGDTHKALADLDQALALNPDSADARAARCAVRLSLKQTKPALTDCDAAITLAPDDAAPLITRATVYLKSHQPKAAIRDYNTVLQRDAENAYALYGRGLARTEAGDAEGGKADMAAARKLSPGVAGHFAE
ncbi:MAG: tetratricopeptide repeat protein [Nevskia sp.]|nr:tetratricopeptide repeat protein [Nevskia sp.]